MIRGTSLRWQLVAWVSGVLVIVLAATFVVVYEATGSRLRDQVDEDVRGDLTQLAETARALPAGSTADLAAHLGAYVQAQPFSGNSSLLFAIVPGHATVSNHAELFGNRGGRDDESAAAQRQENAEGRALLRAGPGLRTATAPDVGSIRLGVRTLRLAGTTIRLGAAEPLLAVSRAQDGVARAFVIAGLLALALGLLASYLAGAIVSRPLRRLSAIAQRVDEGDLDPRMQVRPATVREIRTLAESFNRMLDRLSDAFAQQRAFAADASHELRTPLTVISGQLEVLAAEAEPAPAEIRRVQRIVHAEIARTSRLVDDLLVLARAEQRDFLRPRAIALASWTEELWRATTDGGERRFALGRVPDETLVADPDRLAQALRNLIANAVAHTGPPDGRVELEVEWSPSAARFTVIDDGPGIPAAERGQVFERFHRVDSGRARAAGGAGLGLAIVQAIAVAHGGRSRALAPLDGRGARVQLEIPRR